MESKKKICAECNELSYIWASNSGKKYCKTCWSKMNYSSIKKSQTQIKNRSKKREAMDSLYSILRTKFLNENPACAARLVNCTLQATDVHHTAGRVGDLYLNTLYWLPLCRTCHSYIELHPEEAKMLNFSKSRLKNEL